MSHPTIYPVPAGAAERSLLNNEQYMQMYQQSVSSPDTFWAEHGQRLHWFTPFSKVKSTSFQSGEVNINWFSDGVLNASYNCLDRRVKKMIYIYIYPVQIPVCRYSNLRSIIPSPSASFFLL